MNTDQDYWAARALLEWQVAVGADEAILDQPLDRYALPVEAPWGAARSAASPASGPVRAPEPPPPPLSASEQLAAAVAEAEAAAGQAHTLEDLAAAMAAYERCEIRKGARNFVFADGLPDARVMIVGEAPGREEDIEGRPFVGAAGRLLDKMLAAIGLSRRAPDPARAVYITNVLPWRPPANRTPDAGEIAMLRPFLRRHIALAAPDLLVLMGNTPCQALLDRQGITRLRGNWTKVGGIPCLPMTHPAYLLRTPEAKREAWADLLSLKAKFQS